MVETKKQEIDIFSFPIPSWLDPLAEIKEISQPEAYRNLSGNDKDICFFLNCFINLARITPKLSIKQIFWVTANSCGETGWGEFWKGFNFGGVKCRKDLAKRTKERTGKSERFYRSKGHTKAGDAVVVFYRGFDSPQDFFDDWVDRYVPLNSTPSYNYHEAGKKFWNSDPAWFIEIMKAGYKGENSETNKEIQQGSYNSFLSATKRIQTLFVQFCLGLKTDGSYGPKTRKAVIEFETLHKINSSNPGELSDELVEYLFGYWINDLKGKTPSSIIL